MTTQKIEKLKDEIAKSIADDFKFKINEVISFCDSEIEKLMIVQFYNYFNNYGKNKRNDISYFTEIEFIDEEISFDDINRSYFGHR